MSHAEPGKTVAKWADEFMFKAQEIDPHEGPKVYLLSANNDPLGSIAAAAKAYKGEFVESLAEITDDERRYYLGEIQKTKLEMPLESVNWQFRITGVTRGFTHQLVRQRTAAYSQESTRFAVKEGVPVGLPPSLMGTNPLLERAINFSYQMGWIKNLGEFRKQTLADKMNPLDSNWLVITGSHKIVLLEQAPYLRESIEGYVESGNWREALEREGGDSSSREDRWRDKWDGLMEEVGRVYNELVNDGMPAEDARGALPTNLLTQVNYHTNLRGLKDHAGNRLCTQAQFEWRQVWAEIIKSIRAYGKTQTYTVIEGGAEIAYGIEDPTTSMSNGVHFLKGAVEGSIISSSAWQFDALADIFRPVCYYTGKCEFKADFDRKCTIRDRVDANHKIGRPSTEWHDDHYDSVEVGTEEYTKEKVFIGIPAIRPVEWLLDPSAAR